MIESGKVRALVVDDSEFFAQLTAETLSIEHGITSVYETNPWDTLDRLQGTAEAHGWEVSVAESEAGGARFEITGVEFA